MHFGTYGYGTFKWALHVNRVLIHSELAKQTLTCHYRPGPQALCKPCKWCPPSGAREYPAITEHVPVYEAEITP